MTKPRSSCLAVSLLLLVIGLILGAMLTAGVLLALPGRAAQLFGAPSPNLNSLERISYSALLLVQANDLTQPVDAFGSERRFKIESGETTPSVIGRLWEDGLISNPGVFRTFLRYTGLDTSLQAGSYSLNSGMTPVEIAYALQDATPAEVTFRLLPGWRLEEIAEALPTSGLNISEQDLLDAAHMIPEGYSFSGELRSTSSLEGFLFPDTYVFERTISSEQFLKAMLDNFENKVTPRLRERFDQQGLSLYEAVTLASIVEREAMVAQDMPLVASVFYNRLAIGMKLDSDPTVQYGIGFNSNQNTWWTNPLSLNDLKVQSPYNTYLEPGLPPGPITNPGLLALRAVAFPAQTPYYYFRAGCDESGRHVFAVTFEEHIRNACP